MRVLRDTFNIMVLLFWYAQVTKLCVNNINLNGFFVQSETHWELPSQFVVEQLQVIMVADSLETAHAMSKAVDSPSEVSGIFDSFSYNKGASVIRMTEHIMGTNNFKIALQQYLRAK